MTPQRLEVDNVARSVGLLGSPVTSRADAEELARELHAQPEPQGNEAAIVAFSLGDARRGRELFVAFADDRERSGKIALAALCCAEAARSCTALGLFDEGDRLLTRGLALAARVGARSGADSQLGGARYERAVMTGIGWGRLSAEVGEAALQPQAQDMWLSAVTRSLMARGLAWARQAEPAIVQLAELVAPLDLAGGTGGNYTMMACTAAEALWLLDRRDHIETVERNLRAKVVQPDFRYINVDGRASLGRLCALTGRYDEASRWFAEARTVLEEDGARPLRAIVDYDEALMYARRAADGDRDRALPLLDTAMQQFGEIGMTGWTRLGEELRALLTAAE